LTAGAFAIAALSISAFAGAAQDRAGVTVVAQNKPDDKNKVAPKGVVPRGVAPKQAPARVMEHHQGPPNGGQQNFRVQKKIEVQRNPGPKIVTPSGAPRIINKNNIGGPKAAHRVFTPHGQNSSLVITSRIRNAPARGAFRTSIRGRNYSVWRSGYRARYHGGWRTFVALSALGAIAIGGAEYYPYAYIDAPADYCDGLTEDGCQMVYDEVETEEGDVVPQCVAYCPWQ
jgi:hypothetical protein